MRQFEENIQDGDDIRELCENLLEAVHAVVSNTLRFGDMEDGDEKAPCMALYTVIGFPRPCFRPSPRSTGRRPARSARSTSAASTNASAKKPSANSSLASSDSREEP